MATACPFRLANYDGSTDSARRPAPGVTCLEDGCGLWVTIAGTGQRISMCAFKRVAQELQVIAQELQKRPSL